MLCYVNWYVDCSSVNVVFWLSECYGARIPGNVIKVANGARSHTARTRVSYGDVHYRTTYMNFFKVFREKDRKGINKAEKKRRKSESKEKCEEKKEGEVEKDTE
jgi:hypothetical protein